MSHIHEALKKAQKDRDIRNLNYSGILAASRGKKRSLAGKTIRWVFPFMIVILLAFFYNLWLDFRGLQTPDPQEKGHQRFQTALKRNGPERPRNINPEKTQAIRLRESRPVGPGRPLGIEQGAFQTTKPGSSQAVELKRSQAVAQGSSQAVELKRSQAMGPGSPRAVELKQSQAMGPGSSQAVELKQSQAIDLGPSQAVKLREPQPVVLDKPEAIYERARRFHKEGRLEEAKRLYEETLRLDPGHVDSLNNLGVIFIRKRDYLSAQRNLEKAVRLKPRYAEPYYNLACLNAITGDAKKAMAYLQKAASLDPTVRDWAQRDADLETLRQLPEFKELI